MSGTSLPPAVWALMTDWLPANSDPDRPQLTLSTVNDTGIPDARTVLLSEFDERGFFFHTDARSRKVADIAANPAVAMTFLWPGFTKQLVVQGTAEVAPASEQASAFRARSPYLQQVAWQNSHEFAQLPVDERHARWAVFLESHVDGFDQPDSWIGFLVRPSRLTFWVSDPIGPSHRVEFALTGAGWAERHLAG